MIWLCQIKAWQVFCGTCNIQSDHAQDEVQISKELFNQCKIERIRRKLVNEVNSPFYVDPLQKCEFESSFRSIERILFGAGMQSWVRFVKRLCGSH